MPLTIIEKAPAKLNLSLDVLAKRTDGFHEVETVMVMIDLADYLTFNLRSDKRITLDVFGNAVPNDERNLVIQVAQLLQTRFNVTDGVAIQLEKNIPVTAGMGGGSSDAAATLRALNKLWKLELTSAQLAEIGSEIGSDVAFCVYGGVAKCTGRGEKIQPLTRVPSCWVVLAKPPLSISTREVFAGITVMPKEHTATDAVVSAIEAGDYPGLIQAMSNDLEQYSLHSYEAVAHLKKQFQKFGSDAVLMSGTGPTVFAIVKNQKKAQRLYNSVKGFCEKVHLVQFINAPHQ